MSLLDVIKGSFKSGSHSKSVIGIDIGSSSIKVVQLRRDKGHAVLETYGEIALGPYTNSEIGRTTKLTIEQTSQALIDVIHEANVTERNAGVSIPFSASLTAIIEMPHMDQKQLARMIPLEARKYIPANINDVMLDWFIIPSSPEQEEWSREKAQNIKLHKSAPKTEVLIVAIHNEELNGYQDITERAQLQVGFYELEIFGVVRASLSTGIAPVMIVDLGAATTKVYVIERGIVRFSHLINTGAQDMTLAISRSLGWSFERAERTKSGQGLLVRDGVDHEVDTQVHRALLSTLGRIFSDVNRVLLSYEKKYGRNVSRMVLTGGGAGLPGLIEYVNGQVHIDIERSNPFQKIQTPAFLNEVLTEVGPEFTVAVGMALRRMQE